MVLLDLSGVSYLVFGTQAGHRPTGLQLLLAVVAFSCALLLHRRPLVSLLAQIALLGIAIWPVDDTTINEVGAGWMLLEMAMWAPRLRVVWLSAALLAAVSLTDAIGDPWRRLPGAVFGLSVSVGVPLLLGLVIRTTRELGRQAEERAAEEQRRRESEERAARAGERAAIARELHDVVAHHVASMVLRVGVARHVLPDVDARVAEVFDDVHGTGTAALADLRRLGSVRRDEVAGQDVTAQVVDPDARLANQEAQEAVLRRLMSRAHTVADTIRVQNRLEEVQLQIEEITGTLLYLQNRTSLSTITVSLAEKGAGPPAPPGEIHRAATRALDAALGVVTAVIVATGFLVPIALLCGLALAVALAVLPRVRAWRAGPAPGADAS
jgi:hypothetical protein